MAADINNVVLVGRLTRESELRYTNGGTAVAHFSIAVNRRKRTGDKWEDETSFFDCVLWGKSAENLNPYLEKGKQVCIQGELRQNRWEQDGQMRSKIEIVVNNIELVGPGSGRNPNYSSQRSSGPYQQNKPQPQIQPQTQRPQQNQPPTQQEPEENPPDFGGPEDFDDSDIPF